MFGYQKLREFLDDYKKEPEGTIWIYNGGNLLGSLTSKQFDFSFDPFSQLVGIRDYSKGSFSLSVPFNNFHPLINDSGFVECSIDFNPVEYSRALFSGKFDGE